jgi:O-acetyl-ADP-ribose deacetylase (regulator of RNase III)
MEIEFPSGKKLRLLIGDITTIRVDAIVNAANSGLRGGGGVDGAVHRAGGSGIMRELDEIRKTSSGCPTGSAVVTSAGSLPAQFVFHAVGPIYHDGRHGEADQLAACYRSCLQLAEERGVRSISFPAISTGAYGYPAEEAAAIALETVASHLEAAESGVREVLFVLFDQGFYQLFKEAATRAKSNRIE